MLGSLLFQNLDLSRSSRSEQTQMKSRSAQSRTTTAVLLVVVILISGAVAAALITSNAFTRTTTETQTVMTTTTTTLTKTGNSTGPFLVPLYLTGPGCSNTDTGYTLCGTFDYPQAMVFNCWANLSKPAGCTYNFGTFPQAFNITIRFLPGGLNSTTGYNCEFAYAEPPGELGPQPPPAPTNYQSLCFQTNSNSFVIMVRGYLYQSTGQV
jgi:hypothetical protein